QLYNIQTLISPYHYLCSRNLSGVSSRQPALLLVHESLTGYMSWLRSSKNGNPREREEATVQYLAF
uniref:Uncharacterized protein n=1 Tax=Triticum urartu TaxID=4572 RepID=A0A8R7JV95_TRIUA